MAVFSLVLTWCHYLTRDGSTLVTQSRPRSSTSKGRRIGDGTLTMNSGATQTFSPQPAGTILQIRKSGPSPELDPKEQKFLSNMFLPADRILFQRCRTGFCGIYQNYTPKACLDQLKGRC